MFPIIIQKLPCRNERKEIEVQLCIHTLYKIININEDATVVLSLILKGSLK